MNEEPNTYTKRDAVVRARDAVGRMFQYAVANPDITVDEALIVSAVRASTLDIDKANESDEAWLWKTYSDLAQLVKPATDLSIQIAMGLDDYIHHPNTQAEYGQHPTAARKWGWLFGKKKPAHSNPLIYLCRQDLVFIKSMLLLFVILYIVVQCYNALLSDSLNSSKQLLERLDTLQSSQQLPANKISDPGNIATTTTIGGLSLQTQVIAVAQTFVDLLNPLTYTFFISEETRAIMADCANVASKSGQQAQLYSCLAVQRKYASSVQTVLSRYLLPLLLGFVGATAYLARNALFRLGNNSYVPSPNGMLAMRLSLGGLLGATSGIFISSETEANLVAFDINLTLVALIMGYSVEVAFSLFDSAIERLKAWTRSLRPPAETPDSPPPAAVQPGVGGNKA